MKRGMLKALAQVVTGISNCQPFSIDFCVNKDSKSNMYSHGQKKTAHLRDLQDFALL